MCLLARLGLRLDQSLLELQRRVRVSGNRALDSVRSIRSQDLSGDVWLGTFSIIYNKRINIFFYQRPKLRIPSGTQFFFSKRILGYLTEPVNAEISAARQRIIAFGIHGLLHSYSTRSGPQATNFRGLITRHLRSLRRPH